MKTEFKKGDTVYLGSLKGIVERQDYDNSNFSTNVYFPEIENNFTFTIDGRYWGKTPIVLSHFPYEIEMKKLEPIIEKDTLVWFRDNENQPWLYGYYSHKDSAHFVFRGSKKSTETNERLSWNMVTTENPLK